MDTAAIRMTKSSRSSRSEIVKTASDRFEPVV